MKRQWFVMYFQTSDRRVSPIQTYVEVDVTISTFQLVGHAWLLLPSHWQLELMGYQHHRKQLGSHQPIHPPQPLVFFPWKPHSVAQILSRWHSRPYRRMAVATIFTWCLTLSVISAEEGLWVKHGCQGGMERSSVFQDKCLTDSLRILKEGSMLKWSYIYNTFISLSFVFSLYAHPIQLWQDIIRIPLKKERSSTLRSGLPLACRGHRLREVPEMSGRFGGEDKLTNQSRRIERKTWKYKCCKFRSLFFSTMAIAAIKLNPNHVMCLDHSRQLI